MSNKYYIQIEALNINNYVYDTNDISTIRGGSLLLKRAIARIEEELCDKEKTLKPISTGGSIGVFETEKPISEEDESKIKEELLKKPLEICREEAPEATFCGSVRKKTKDFKGDLDCLQREIRREQFKHPTFILPSKVCQFNTSYECELDGRRPAKKEDTIRGKLSEITDKRRKEGIKMKAPYLNDDIVFTKEELKKKNHEEKYVFTWDLGQLAENKDKNNRLNNKIAFLHFDGNKFGKIKDEFCTDAQKLGEYDQKIQGNQRGIISDYIKSRSQDEDLHYWENFVKTDKLQIEVLLWGGDEFDIILPAWKGIDFIKFFMDENRNSQPIGRYPLTYGIGVVFCHHNAPILQIRELAHNLTNKVKQQVSPNDKIPENHSEGDAFHYLILETIDMLSSSLEDFINKYYSEKRFEELLIRSGEMFNGNNDILKGIRVFKASFPRGKLYKMLRLLKRDELHKVEEVYKKAVESVPNVKFPEFKEIEERNFRRLYLIADLWDYVQNEKEKK